MRSEESRLRQMKNPMEWETRGSDVCMVYMAISPAGLPYEAPEKFNKKGAEFSCCASFCSEGE